MTYFLVFLFVAVMAASEVRTLGRHVNKVVIPKPDSSLWFFVTSILILMIGMRYQVGGDWEAYGHRLEAARNTNFSQLNVFGDIGYDALNWVGANIIGGVFLPNFVCALIFSLGLSIFCLNQSRPWLALLVAIPYLSVVVAMGYTRQAAAIGIGLIGLVSLLSERRGLKFLIFVGASALFHKSAVILAGLIVFLPGYGALPRAVIFLCVISIVAAVLVQEAVISRYTALLAMGRESSGALIRVVMTAIPAMIFLLFRKRFQLETFEHNIWLCFAILTLVLFFGIFVSPSSTVIDRIALYVIVLQIFVISNLPDIFRQFKIGEGLTSVAIIVYCFAILFIWLSFANNSNNWLPYRFFPWEFFWGEIYESSLE